MSNQLNEKHARPMKVLFMADYFLPHAGGSRVYYFNLYSRLVRRFPTRLTTLTKKLPGWQEFDRRESSPNFRIRRHLTPLPNWKYWQWPRMAAHFADAALMTGLNDFDCVHCGDLLPQGLSGALLQKLFKLPLTMFCHGDEISQTDRFRYLPKVRNAIYRRADAVIAANQFAVNQLVRIGVRRERIHKITPGVDMDLFQPRPPKSELVERYRLAHKKVLLSVARLVPRKGHKIVLQALKKVLPRVPDVAYLIAGEGPEKANLQKMVNELELHDVVQFVGDVSHDQISDYYSLCDVFVMINRLEAGGDVESFGMVFTEANAVGKPVIGGSSGGSAEAVLDGRTGFLVDPNDVDAVSQKLIMLLSDTELRRKMGAAGLERVRDEFNWDTRVEKLHEINCDLVRKRSYQTVTSASAAIAEPEK